jgi:catechol 2,3-dioxygenase-like lactoylglutathione lyase family enzyme
MVFDHVGLNVKDYPASRAFYEAALAPLGYEVVTDFADWKAVGFREGETELWVAEREPCGTGTHVAFVCADRATVDAFHAAAVGAGGLDNGAPGIREQYHPTYYAAFVLDPDGNNIEAVCQHG